MAEIACLNGHREWINLEPHLTGLSLPNTVDLLDCLGVKRSHKAIHDRVRKADLQPEAGQIPNHIALDETVIRINDQQYWLYAAADPETNHLLHVRLFSTTTTALTEMFLRELREKHDVETAVFLVDGANISKLHFDEQDSAFRCVATEIGMLSNGFFEN